MILFKDGAESGGLDDLITNSDKAVRAYNFLQEMLKSSDEDIRIEGELKSLYWNGRVWVAYCYEAMEFDNFEDALKEFAEVDKR